MPEIIAEHVVLSFSKNSGGRNYQSEKNLSRAQHEPVPTTHSLTDLVNKAVQRGLNTSIQSEWASAATEI